MSKFKIASSVAGAVLVAALAACSGSTVSKTTDSSLAGTLAKAKSCTTSGGTWTGSTCMTSSPTPSATPVTTGPLGTTFEIATEMPGGIQVTYDVTADKVDQHAPLGSYETLNNSDDHLVAVKFTIKGVAGDTDDDANGDAVVIGTDTTLYPFSDDGTTDGPNFSYGDFQVAPRQTVSGWVTFEVPDGQSVTEVQWSPGYAGGAATWNV